MSKNKCGSLEIKTFEGNLVKDLLEDEETEKTKKTKFKNTILLMKLQEDIYASK